LHKVEKVPRSFTGEEINKLTEKSSYLSEFSPVNPEPTKKLNQTKRRKKKIKAVISKAEKKKSNSQANHNNNDDCFNSIQSYGKFNQ
jgi:hypothetical protein